MMPNMDRMGLIATIAIAIAQPPDYGIGPGKRSRLRHPEEPLYRAGRNQPCPCGSGLKFKRCCAGKPARRITIDD